MSSHLLRFKKKKKENTKNNFLHSTDISLFGYLHKAFFYILLLTVTK